MTPYRPRTQIAVAVTAHIQRVHIERDLRAYFECLQRRPKSYAALAWRAAIGAAA